MRVARAVAMAGLGVALAGALTVGVGVPANADILYNLRDYQQTLPADVIDDQDLTTDEKTKLTNNTRAGVVGDRNVVPVGTRTPGPRSLFPALNVAFMISDTIPNGEVVFDRDEDVRPDYIDQEEWDACAESGGDDWLGSFFDRARDWTASFDGLDCNEVREGWQTEKNPDYEPIGGPVSPFVSYPFTLVSNGVTANFGAPHWSSVMWSPSTGGARQEGWVIPILHTGGGTADPLYRLYPELVTSAGLQTNVPTAAVTSRSYPASTLSASSCGGIAGAQCVVLDKLFQSTTGLPAAWAGTDAISTIAQTRLWGTSDRLPIQPLPFVNPRTGSYSPSTELARQVILAWAKTESGNTYQCRTVSFVETAPTIPRPCTPDVPPGEVITETGWEVVPETDTGYVPGSNPTRGIQTTTVPDVVRDWQRDYDQDAETLLLLDLELEGVGDCFDFPDECADWFTDPNKTTKYTCRYGGQVIDLAQCAKYAQIFKPGAITNGQAYPTPGTNPGAQPGGQTSTPPAAGVTEPGSEPASPENRRECFPTGWGVFNPFEWVYKPIKCVVEWAFVPRQSVINQRFASLSARTLSKGPIALATAVTGWEIQIAPAGCSGITVPFSQVWSQTDDIQILNACAGEPLAPIATLSSVVIGIASVLGAIFAASRNFGGIVQYGGLSE